MRSHIIAWTRMAFVWMLLCWSLSESTCLAAKGKEYKYGKVSVEELTQNTCPIDSTADAMILYHDTKTYMTARTDLLLITEYKTRIKVLTEEGKDEANISIRIYNNRGSGKSDRLSGLSASVYNLENGQVVTTKMDKSYVSEERVSDYYTVTKVALPNVKVGSVIEYKYTLTSDRYYLLPTWYAQRPEPVLQCHCDVTIPEYFGFSQNMVGGCNIQFEEDYDTSNFLGQQISSKVYKYDAVNLPGVKREKLVYATNYYVGSVRYELSSLTIPGQVYKNFSTSWDDVRKQVLSDSHFSSYLHLSNPFKEEMSDIIASGEKVIVKAQKIYGLLKEKVKWDESYTFLGSQPKTAVKEGKGSNAQLNFLLMSMLRDADIRCTPLMIKFRDKGPLPLTHATSEELNTFVVAFCDENRELFFLDGSADFGGINVLPTNLLGEGVLLEPAQVSGQMGTYRLSDLGGASQVITSQATIDPSGKLSVTRRTQFLGMMAQEYRKALHNAAGDTTSIIQDFEQKNGAEVHALRFNDRKVIETMVYTVGCDVVGDEIYVNAMCVPEEHTNHFTAETRQLPVMFPFLQSEKVTSQIMIPAGYEVASLPEQTVIQTSDGSLAAILDCKQQGEGILTSYQFEISATVLPVNVYAEVQDFWKKLIDMNSQMIVFKKTANQ